MGSATLDVCLPISSSSVSLSQHNDKATQPNIGSSAKVSRSYAILPRTSLSPVPTMSSDVSAPPRVVRGGLKLKGGVVIRAAPSAPLSTSTTSSSHSSSLKRKLPTDASSTESSVVAKDEVTTPASTADSSTASPTAPTSVDHVKRTRALGEVEETNAALQALDRATERLDRSRLIADEKERLKATTPAGAEAAAVGAGSGAASTSRLVDVSRHYAHHGFGDEQRLQATSKLNAREKKKSDRYCK